MAEYTNVEKPFLEKLKSLGWEVIDHGAYGIPQAPEKSFRNSFNEVVLEDVFRKTIRKINLTQDGKEWLTDKQLDEVFEDKEIVVSLIRQLSWTHFREIIYLDDSLQRDFYAEMCRIERWNTRTLKSKIQGMLYERTAISKKPGEETPLGLILCARKTSEQIELLKLDKGGIRVTEYMTELPKRKLLEQKLHKAVELARKRLEA